MPGGEGRSELVDAPIEAEVRDAMEVDVEVKVPEEEEPEWMGHIRSIDEILGGKKTIALHQEFLIRNNNSDLQVLKNTKVRFTR